MKPATPKTIKELITLSKTYYPDNIVLQRQWIRKTKMLYQTGRHAAFTGGFPVHQI